MTALEQMRIELDGLSHILSDNMLSVPMYQRAYAWTAKKEVAEFLQDIATAINNKEKEYFLGTIVITRGRTPRPEVVDGQQRLATTAILIAAIRDYFVRVGDRERAESLERDYLLAKDLRTQDSTPRLQLNALDNEFFRLRVLEHPESTGRKAAQSTKTSHRRIIEAAEAAAGKVDELAKLTSRPTDYLIDWIEFLRNNARVILLEVPDDTNAFTIFETLNDRGLRLALSDLLKNYLFGESQDRIAEVQQRWIKMLGTLEAVGEEELVVTFIRHLWSSNHGLTREKDLYKEIKSSVTTKTRAVEFTDDLQEMSRLYAAILNPSHELWTKYGTMASKHMTALNDLGMTQMRPLLMAILERLPPKEVEKSLRLLTSWAVRFMIHGGLGSGSLETHYCNRAVELRKAGVSTARHLVTKMKGIVPNDSQFKASFATATVSKAFLARYFLRVLENQSKGDVAQPVVPSDNEQVVNLEHILPQNPSPAWSHLDVDTCVEYYKRLGNLALLETGINSNIGNGGFMAKREHYERSPFRLTASLKEFSSWGPIEIDKRQAELAELAVKAWPYSV